MTADDRDRESRTGNRRGVDLGGAKGPKRKSARCRVQVRCAGSSGGSPGYWIASARSGYEARALSLRAAHALRGSSSRFDELAARQLRKRSCDVVATPIARLEGPQILRSDQVVRAASITANIAEGIRPMNTPDSPVHLAIVAIERIASVSRPGEWLRDGEGAQSPSVTTSSTSSGRWIDRPEDSRRVRTRLIVLVWPA